MDPAKNMHKKPVIGRPGTLLSLDTEMTDGGARASAPKRVGRVATLKYGGGGSVDLGNSDGGKGRE